jgi:hypothetical protein
MVQTFLEFCLGNTPVCVFFPGTAVNEVSTNLFLVPWNINDKTFCPIVPGVFSPLEDLEFMVLEQELFNLAQRFLIGNVLDPSHVVDRYGRFFESCLAMPESVRNHFFGEGELSLHLVFRR